MWYTHATAVLRRVYRKKAVPGTVQAQRFNPSRKAALRDVTRVGLRVLSQAPPKHKLLRRWCGHRAVTTFERQDAAEDEVQRLVVIVARLICELRQRCERTLADVIPALAKRLLDMQVEVVVGRQLATDAQLGPHVHDARTGCL